MKLKNISRYVAPSSRVVMTIVIFLFVVSILQGIAIEVGYEITRMLTETKRKRPPAEPTKELSEAEKKLWRIRRSGKNFLPDGTIHLTYRVGLTPGRKGEPEKVQIYDANDTLVWQGPANENPYEYLSWSDAQRFRRHLFTDKSLKRIQMITPEFSQVLEIPVRAQDGTKQVWRYLPSSDLFVGYRLDGQKIGFLGSTGFARSKSEAKPFGRFKFQSTWNPAEASEPTVLWQTARRIYQINFQKQNIRVLFESPEANIKAVVLRECRPEATQTPEAPKIQYRPTIRCLTEDGKHHLIMRNPEQKLTITVPDDRWGGALQFAATRHSIFLLRRDSEIRLPYLKSSKLILEWLRRFEGKPHKEWVELYRVDDNGKLHLINRFDWTVPADFRFRATVFRLRVIRATAAVSAPLYDLAWYLLGREFFTQRYRGNDFVSSLTRMIADVRPQSSILNWVLALAMMGFAFWHGWPRRTSRAKFVFWLVFVGAFNLLGLLTYLALNHTALIKCRACGRRRGLAQVNCARCGVELPAPERGKLDLISNN